MFSLVKYGVAADLYTVLLTRASLDAKDNPTLAAGDVQVSKDGGAYANITTLPSAVPSGSDNIKIPLSATELTCKTITIRFKDQTNPAEWEQQRLILQTYGHASAMIPGIAADLMYIDGQATAGNNATLKLKQLDITNSAGTAVIFASSGSNGNGMSVSGNGSGHAALYTGGATGDGIKLLGGATSGVAFRVTGQGGNGAEFTGGTNSTALKLQGTGTGAALGAAGGASADSSVDIYSMSGNKALKLSTDGGAAVLITCLSNTNAALEISGGAYGAVKISSPYTNAIGVRIAGYGTGEAVQITAGATGNGISIYGGATSGYGIYSQANTGSGIRTVSNDGGAGFLAEAFGAGYAAINGLAHGVGGIGMSMYSIFGNGAEFAGGATTSYGIKALAGSEASGLYATGFNGVEIVGGSVGYGIKVTGYSAGGKAVGIFGVGAHAGLTIQGGATGNGIDIRGGATSGQAVDIRATSGYCLFIAGDGTTPAVHVENGATGTSVQIGSSGSGVGVDIYGAKALSLRGYNGGGSGGAALWIDGGINEAVIIKNNSNGLKTISITNSGSALEIYASKSFAGQNIVTSQAIRDAMDIAGTNSSGDAANDSITYFTAQSRTGIYSYVLPEIADIPVDVDTQLSGTHGAGSWQTGGSLTAQQTRDAMKLAPSSGAADAGSVDAKLDTIAGDTDVINDIDTDVGSLLSGLTAVSGKIDIIDTNVDTVLTDTGAIETKVDTVDDKVEAVALAVADCLKGTDTIDGKSVNHIFELVMAMANGRFKRDFPEVGDITFYKRDNATVLTVVNNSDTERTRVS